MNLDGIQYPLFIGAGVIAGFLFGTSTLAVLALIWPSFLPWLFAPPAVGAFFGFLFALYIRD